MNFSFIFHGCAPVFSSFLIVFNSAVSFMPNSSLLDEISIGSLSFISDLVTSIPKGKTGQTS